MADPELETLVTHATVVAPEPAGQPKPTGAERAVAFIEVLLCSDYPTQLALGSALLTFGIPAFRPDGGLSLGYVAALSLIDTVVLVGLILLFLRAHGEDPQTLFLGRKPAGREMLVGVGLTFIALTIAVVVLGAILQFAPMLHTVEHNPLKDLMRTPRDAAVFAFVVVVAGGVREEVQRAFLLHRFDRWLGGGKIGVALTSAAFGMGHLPQGVDAVVATGLLGAFWGVVYLRRRSIVAPIVSHSCFNLLELVQFVIVPR